MDLFPVEAEPSESFATPKPPARVSVDGPGDVACPVVGKTQPGARPVAARP